MSTYEERMGIEWYKVLVDGLFSRYADGRVSVSVDRDEGYKVSVRDEELLMMPPNDSARFFTLFGLDSLSLKEIRAKLATRTVGELGLLGVDTSGFREHQREQAAQFIKYSTVRQQTSIPDFLGGEAVRTIERRMQEDFGTWVERVPVQVVPSFLLSETSAGQLRPKYLQSEDARREGFVNLLRGIGGYTVQSFTDSNVRYKGSGRSPRTYIFSLSRGEQGLSVDELAKLYHGKWKLSEPSMNRTLYDLFTNIVGNSGGDEYSVMKWVLKHGEAAVHAWIDKTVAETEAKAPGIEALWGKGKGPETDEALLQLVCSGPEAPLGVNGRYKEGSMGFQLSQLTLLHGEEVAREVARKLYVKKE